MSNKEILSGQEICDHCHNCVTMQYTPGGLKYCPSCSYSPLLKTVLQGTTTSDHHGFIPPFPRKIQ